MLIAATIGITPATPTASAVRLADPLRFFEGKTESVSTVRVMMKKPYRARTFGQGRLHENGSLILVQRVEDEGRRPFERRWQIRRVSAGEFTGTMSEAKGPVTIAQVGERYRFRFKMKGGLSVEQWITPLPDGKSARSASTVKKLGVKVAISEGTIRKLV
jgi:hypothetical protein